MARYLRPVLAATVIKAPFEAAPSQKGLGDAGPLSAFQPTRGPLRRLVYKARDCSVFAGLTRNAYRVAKQPTQNLGVGRVVRNSMKKKRQFMLFVAGLALALISAGQAYAQLSANLAINNTARVSTDHIEVTVTGKYTCGPLPAPEISGFATINVNVVHASGRLLAMGFSGIDVSTTCDDVQHTFTVNVPTSNIPWHGGLARVMGSLIVSDCSVSPCLFANASVDETIRLH